MSQWTVKRPEPEQSQGARVGSYLFGVVLFAALGGLAGALLPMFLATTGGGRRQGETWRQRAVRRDIADAAMDQTIHDTKDSMLGRVLIGALLGGAGGGFLAFKTEAARKKKLS